MGVLFPSHPFTEKVKWQKTVISVIVSSQFVNIIVYIFVMYSSICLSCRLHHTMSGMNLVEMDSSSSRRISGGQWRGRRDSRDMSIASSVEFVRKFGGDTVINTASTFNARFHAWDRCWSLKIHGLAIDEMKSCYSTGVLNTWNLKLRPRVCSNGVMKRGCLLWPIKLSYHFWERSGSQFFHPFD